MPQNHPVIIPFAICAMPMAREGDLSRIQIFPAGEFSVPHGALRGKGPWRLDAVAAGKLIETVSARKTPLVIDYEHQSLLAASNGMPAPAAGWVEPSALRWTDEGLFAAATWTDRAKEMIAAGEYAYLSPVFTYNASGVPTDILNLALTNNPAIDGMQPVLLAAASRLPKPTQPKEAPTMQHAAVTALLGIAEDADDAAIVAACQALTDKLKKADEAIACASALPDPEKFAPVAGLIALQNEVAALRSALSAREIDDLVDPALADGRLSIELEPWARELGRSNLAALKTFLEKAQPIAALSGSQTGGKPPVTSETAAASVGVPDGLKVDSVAAELDRKARAYQKQNPGVSYLDAAIAVGG